MAPALASASASTDSIKGLAQSIAKPAYRRLLVAEPALRRAVPVLIIAFLLTMAVGAGVQVNDHRHQAIATVVTELDAIADLLNTRLDQAATTSKNDVLRGAQDLLIRSLPPHARNGGRAIFVSDLDGNVIAAAPYRMLGQPLLDILGPDQPLTTFGATAGVLETPLADGTEAFATVRLLKAPLGQVAVIQSRANALAPWRSDTMLTITLSATTGFVVLILGFAFHWQATRAREADAIYDTVRARIDTALNRGRCGLWDWDLARGRIFWSHSMFAILGLDPRDDLLTFGEVGALVHPDDIRLYELATQLVEGETNSIDRGFRMRHACGDWVWLRARCEIIRQSDGGDPHLIGIAVDITEQKHLMEKTIAADLRLRDAIETIPEAFVLWDADNRLVLCNSNFQALHDLPDHTITAGTAYEAVVAAGRRPVVRTTSANDDCPTPGARTFEAQLEDGRWLHISERRTKDGGYVSVGTDITNIKLHEEKLIHSERRLMATVADLRTSQQVLESQAQQLSELAEKYSEEKTRAEEANKVKSKFLANMSHELRTPLNAILGFSEIMGSGMFGPLGTKKYDEYCRDIHSSGQYLLEVINDVLDMSKIEAGRMRLVRETLILDQLLADALRVVSGRATEKKLALALDVTPDIAFEADSRACKQIVLNLLSNAVKFTPDGGRVNVRGRMRGRSLVVAIDDSGIGIPRDALAKLGRPFEQVESQLTKSHQGSGLGLAIAKSLVELHGGIMRIRSRLGIGTIVVVRLPVPAQHVGRRAQCGVRPCPLRHEGPDPVAFSAANRLPIPIKSGAVPRR